MIWCRSGFELVDLYLRCDRCFSCCDHCDCAAPLHREINADDLPPLAPPPLWVRPTAGSKTYRNRR